MMVANPTNSTTPRRMSFGDTAGCQPALRTAARSGWVRLRLTRSHQVAPSPTDTISKVVDCLHIGRRLAGTIVRVATAETAAVRRVGSFTEDACRSLS